MSVISMKQLLEAGVHFGHQTRRWNPKMAPYIYTERNGIYIIDLQQSVGMVDDAYNAIADIVANGGKELPITDYRMTRFWISLDEGVQLVIKALSEAKGGETFISKIPSFKITDLAQAILPGCEMPEVGIREGEKLHEIMVTREDSMMTYEYDKHFIVYPHFDWWDNSKIQPGGKKVESGFEYSSGKNTEWLSVDEIARRLKDVKEH